MEQEQLDQLLVDVAKEIYISQVVNKTYRKEDGGELIVTDVNVGSGTGYAADALKAAQDFVEAVKEHFGK